MKLVDILARDLEDWPDCDEIFQDYDGELRYIGHPVSTCSNCFVEMCDDLIRPKYGCNIKGVTRDQWQEARDTPINSDAKEWNGEGLPPVGAVCEWAGCSYAPEDPKEPDLHLGDQVKIIAHFKDGDYELAAFTFNPGIHNPARGTAWVNQGAHGCFRPIRTPEQIAAEERKKAVMEMISDGGSSLDLVEFVGRLYDANYRKQEPK